MSDDLTDFKALQEQPSLFVEEIIGIEPFDYQREFMDHDSSRKVFVAGRQVGKSRTASWMALHYAVTHPDSLVLVTADALRQSSELFNQLQSEISEAGLSDEAWGIDRSTQTEIEFDHESRIKVVPTGRNGHKIRGFTADMVIVDEAAFVEDKIFEEVIEPMLWASDGELVLTSTPFGASGYFYDKARRSELSDSRWFKQHAEPTMNPMIDEAEIESYKEGKTSKQIKQEVYGEFVPTGDQFFPDPLIRSVLSDDVERGVIQYPSENANKRVDEDAAIFAGLDLASGGEDQTVIAITDEYGNVFSVEQHDISLPESKQRMQTLDRHYNFERIIVDRTGLGEGPVADLRQTIGNKVEDVYLSTQQKQSVYQTLKSEMESGNVTIQSKKDIRVQLSNMGYDKTKTGNLSIHAKGDFHDDIPDAIALAIWGMPDVAGSGSHGAQGMTEAMTIGKVRKQGDGKKAYEFGSDERDDDLDRTTVGSRVFSR